LTAASAAADVATLASRQRAVTRAMAAGDRSSRVGQLRAPGELRELAAAFDQMAGALDRQDQLRRDLVADVAHELRTPIAVLQAGNEALLDGVAEPTPDQLTSLRDEVLRLARMVGDLQTLAEADATALRLSRSRADLAAIASSAADSFADRFDAAGIAFTRHLAPVEVLADAGRLYQVVTNLLTNVRDHALRPPCGCPSGRESLTPRESGHERSDDAVPGGIERRSAARSMTRRTMRTRLSSPASSSRGSSAGSSRG
jgi:two-component system, OmpR family, sensor histidine kinase BaeS